MRGRQVARHLYWVILLMPAAALAQFGATPLQPPPQPAGNVGTPAKESLGKALFWDEQLSSNRTTACGTCHHASVGGLDPRATAGVAGAVHPGFDGIFGTGDDAVGSPGVTLRDGSAAFAWSPFFGIAEQVTRRRSMPHINGGYNKDLFWDGRAGEVFRDPLTGAIVMSTGGALESQALFPLVSSVEMGHLGRDWADVTARVTNSVPLALATDIPAALETWLGSRSYPDLFQEAFGTPEVTPVRIAMAIASYQRTLCANQTPLDSALAGIRPLSAQETRGRNVFNGSGGCNICHRGALVGHMDFDNNGLRPAAEDSGLAAVTLDDRHMAFFRIPSLRNGSLQQSFMHNGQMQTLEEVLEFYDRGGDFDDGAKSQLVQPLGMAPQQKADLLAFLRRPLTDPRVAAGLPPFDEPQLYGQSTRVPQVLTGGVAGIGGIPQVVALEPPVAGNPAFTVGIFAGRTGAQATLVIDDAEPPTGAGIPAAGSLARTTIALQGASTDDGFGSVTVPIPLDPNLYDDTYFGRWYVVDPDAPGGVAASPSFRMTVFAPRNGPPPVSVPIVGPGPERIALSSSPNPFTSSTVIRYTLPIASPVTLTIYDLKGRPVRALVRHAMEGPGPHSVRWDGRDDQGRVLAGAVYFSRLEAAGMSARFMVVRVR